MKGTYALKEWGFERPSKTLFEIVAKIVREEFEKTGVPVQKNVIISEIGKYRRIVHPSSMTIAIHYNPYIKCVSKDTFIPEQPDKLIHDEVNIDKLDELLKDFEKEVSPINKE